MPIKRSRATAELDAAWARWWDAKPGDRRWEEQRRLRGLFLAEVEQNYPVVLRDLRDAPYKHFVALMDRMVVGAIPGADPRRPILWHDLEDGCLANQSAIAPLHDALLKWSRFHRLDAEWIRDAALATMAFWYRQVEPPSDPSWAADPHARWADPKWGGPPFEVRLPGWSHGLPRELVEAILIDEATKQIRERLDAVEAIAASRGHLSNAESKVTAQHVGELVQYQVAQRGWTVIAENADVAPIVVKRRVEKAAVVLGLQLRPVARRPRPRKGTRRSRVVKIDTSRRTIA